MIAELESTLNFRSFRASYQNGYFYVELLVVGICVRIGLTGIKNRKADRVVKSKL